MAAPDVPGGGGAPRLTVGDIMPAIAFGDMAGGAVDLNADHLAGNYIVLLLRRDAQVAGRQLAAYRDKQDILAQAGGRLFVVLPADAPAAKSEITTVAPALHDRSGAAFAMFAADGTADAVSVMIGPNQHIAVIARDADDRHVDQVLAHIAARADARRSQRMDMHPPVLLVPDVLSPADCQKLISIYRFQGNEVIESGHNVLQGRTSDCKMKVDDYGRTDRVDHWVITPDSNAFIDQRLKSRLFPEIKKTFQYKITGREHYRIACYEGERAGEAHGHRDDSEPIVAHRRFAVTINLNTENYDGAELRFPEFGDQRYRPPTGAAIVFSCSLLHEVMHMAAGRRFALLAFLFGDS